MKAKEHQQQLQMQQMHFLQQRNAQMQRRDPNHPPLGAHVNAMNNDGMMGKPSPSTLGGMKIYEESMKPSHSMDSETSPALLDASRMALLKSATNHQGYAYQLVLYSIISPFVFFPCIIILPCSFGLCSSRQLMQGNSANMSASLQQIQGRSQMNTVYSYKIILLHFFLLFVLGLMKLFL